ncbi:rhomboid family intramembrane serine protease [Dokdonella sp.]|uniref:rhomboid family intramembrane serine protease n=1 Tax=Dokdonella sp. TaxID=2291710 RepID=UPI003C7190B3
MPIDLPPVTRALLIANLAIFGLQQLIPDPMIMHFALWPLGTDLAGPDGTRVAFGIWQLVSYGFLHGGLPHLFFNMLALWMFGGAIERLFGSRPFATYYLACVVGAAVAQLIVVRYFTGGIYPTLGASGGGFGLLLAFGMMFPHQRLMLLFPPIPMPAWLFVTAYGAIELFLGVTGTQAGVAHFAHLGGMAAGFVIIQYWRGRLPLKPRRILMR